jgi:hypothetical protein
MCDRTDKTDRTEREWCFVASGESRDVEVVDLGSEEQEVCFAILCSREPLTSTLCPGTSYLSYWILFSEASVIP